MADGGHSVAPRAHQLSPPPALVAPVGLGVGTGVGVGVGVGVAGGFGLGASVCVGVGSEPRLNHCTLLPHASDEAARSRPLPLPPGASAGVGGGSGGDEERPFERSGTGGTNSARSSKKKLMGTPPEARSGVTRLSVSHRIDRLLVYGYMYEYVEQLCE